MKVNERTVVGGLIGHCVSPPTVERSVCMAVHVGAFPFSDPLTPVLKVLAFGHKSKTVVDRVCVLCILCSLDVGVIAVSKLYVFSCSIILFFHIILHFTTLPMVCYSSCF